jgi:hypothetical protein
LRSHYQGTRLFKEINIIADYSLIVQGVVSGYTFDIPALSQADGPVAVPYRSKVCMVFIDQHACDISAVS